MSVTAYVFIECEHGTAMDTVESMEKIGGVRSAKAVTGPYDVIAYVEASNFKVLGEVVIKKIQALPGVKRTLTNVVID